MSDISELVRTTRKSQRLSQEDLAGISGTGRRFISDIENGKESIHLGKLLLVISALGLTLEVPTCRDVKSCVSTVGEIKDCEE